MLKENASKPNALLCNRKKTSPTRDLLVFYIWCCSVAQSCLSLCNPTNCSMPGFPILHHFLELAQTHIHQVGDAIPPSYPLPSHSPPPFSLAQHQGSFQMSQFFTSCGQSIDTQLQHQSFQWIFRVDFP